MGRISFLGSYVENSGVVLKKHHTGITVYLNPEVCSTKEHCSPGKCASCADEKPFQAKIFCKTTTPNKFALQQRITIRHFQIQQAIAALLLFGVPIATVIISLLLHNLFITNAPRQLSETITGAAALIAGLCFTIGIDRIIHRCLPATIISND